MKRVLVFLLGMLVAGCGGGGDGTPSDPPVAETSSLPTPVFQLNLVET